MAKLILASSSPARRQLISQLGIDFVSINPNIDETPLPGESPEALVARLAQAKAQKVASFDPSATVIGSDQVGVFQGSILGKPLKREVARENLKRFSGSHLKYLTSLAVYRKSDDLLLNETVETIVHFRELTDQDIERYLDRESALTCAGGLKVEGLGICLLEAIDSQDQSALIGLPLIALTTFLRQAGIALP